MFTKKFFSVVLWTVLFLALPFSLSFARDYGVEYNIDNAVKSRHIALGMEFYHGVVSHGVSFEKQVASDFSVTISGAAKRDLVDRIYRELDYGFEFSSGFLGKGVDFTWSYTGLYVRSVGNPWYTIDLVISSIELTRAPLSPCVTLMSFQTYGKAWAFSVSRDVVISRRTISCGAVLGYNTHAFTELDGWSHVTMDASTTFTTGVYGRLFEIEPKVVYSVPLMDGFERMLEVGVTVSYGGVF